MTSDGRGGRGPHGDAHIVVGMDIDQETGRSARWAHMTRWTPQAVVDVIGSAKGGMTAVEFAAVTDLSVGRAYRVLARAVDSGRLATDGGGAGKAPARYSVRDVRPATGDADVVPMPRTAAPKKLRDRSDWQIVYQLQESDQERDGMHVLSEVAATLEYAMQLADERAGRWAPGAGEWRHDGSLTSPEFQPWVREVPNLCCTPVGDFPHDRLELSTGYQHITPVLLYGAPR